MSEPLRLPDGTEVHTGAVPNPVLAAQADAIVLRDLLSRHPQDVIVPRAIVERLIRNLETLAGKPGPWLVIIVEHS